MPRNYNHIYRALVEDKDDVVGHIAYALYKEDKIAYIERFKQDNEDREPDEKDLKPFHDTTNSPGSLDRYKSKAASILGEFMNSTLEETIKDIERESVASHKDHLEEIIAPLKPKGIWANVGQNIISSVITIAIISALLFFLSLTRNSYVITFGGDGATSINKCIKHTNDSTKK